MACAQVCQDDGFLHLNGNVCWDSARGGTCDTVGPGDSLVPLTEVEPRARTAALTARFREAFGITPAVYRAPGRVNLIGEHTDYNDGFVMPVALALGCWVAAAPRDDGLLLVHSANLDERVEVDCTQPLIPSGGWRDYVVGVAAMLQAQGCPLRGATLLIDSQVPVGAGLSSSAALEVAIATALIDIGGFALAPATLAGLCQRAENEFAGAASGIMDQFVACHARAGTALMLDCRSLEYRLLPLPRALRLVACNTMVRHSIAAGEYNRRHAECDEAVARLAAVQPSVRSLRDVDVAVLERGRGVLTNVLFRRARHVVTENERVLLAADALERGELGVLGTLMAESHRSLRDDYEVSCPELDHLVEIAAGMTGVYGARMTGGGFGGCSVNLVHEDAVDEFSQRVPPLYERRWGRAPEIYVAGSADAAGRVDG